MKHTQPRFPVGGAREPVYRFLLEHGFTMSDWSDKHWNKADGSSIHIYGSGSMARVYKDGKLLADDSLEAAVSRAATNG